VDCVATTYCVCCARSPRDVYTCSRSPRRMSLEHLSIRTPSNALRSYTRPTLRLVRPSSVRTQNCISARVPLYRSEPQCPCKQAMPVDLPELITSDHFDRPLPANFEFSRIRDGPCSLPFWHNQSVTFGGGGGGGVGGN
jgi:hypothetical protein